MASLNRWQGIGRLGKDPEVRSLDNGNTVASFSIAVTESYKDRTSGEKKETTEWVNLVCWKGLADIAGKYLHKGDMIFCEGKLKTRTWEKDNVTRYITEVVLDNMTMLSSKGGNKLGNVNGNVSHSAAGNGNNSADDLPF